MNRDSLIQLLAALMLTACVGLSAFLGAETTAEASRAQLTYTDEAVEGDPPEVAVGVAMGAFRGLFVNYLWIRANKLKEEGKFYEAIQLSSAITRLQPRFPRVWAFHAWNMAYNISVATNTAEERWQWVKAGINLLRSEGIPRNPNDVLLHRELAWTFIHKIQGYADDANHYYKREVAREWTILLGDPPRLDGTSDENKRTMAEWMRLVANAPQTLEQVAQRESRARAAAENLRPGDPLPPARTEELVNRIRAEARLDLDINLLRLIEYRKAWVNAWYVREHEFSRDLREGDRNDALDALMSEPAYEATWPPLLEYVRRRVITEQFHMEPERMVRYTEKFGPLDWRHPASHALYWAARGVEEGLERQGTTQFDTLNTDRIIMHSMQELFRFGAIQYDLLTNEYFALNNFDWVDPYGNMLEEVIARGGIAANIEERAYTLYGAGFENFLKDVIRIYYQRGDLANAEKYHSKLRNWPGLNINDAGLIDDLKLPLAEFVEKELRDRLTTPHVAINEMEAALTDAFLRGLAQGQPEVFRRQLEYADRVRSIYLETQNMRTLADPEARRMAQFVGASLAETATRVLMRLLSGGSFGYYRLGPQQAALLYRRTPLSIQRAVYDDLSSAVQRTQGVSPEQFAALFPEPPGLEQFRAAMANAETEQEKARVRAIEFQKDANRRER
ncbi:MAG: hypothetical protein SFZ24_12920 [Planctomycetota bacterium]|nr:hypothetical protein [Planctomycetota bacterium]